MAALQLGQATRRYQARTLRLFAGAELWAPVPPLVSLSHVASGNCAADRASSCMWSVLVDDSTSRGTLPFSRPAMSTRCARCLASSYLT